MPGRHTASAHATSRALPLFLVLLVALAVGVGGFFVTGVASSIHRVTGGGCTGSVPVSVAATAESVDVVRAAADSVEQRKAEAAGACVDYQVRAVSPAAVSRSIDARAADVPDLWVPDSSAWLERVGVPGAELSVVVESLAKSPVVVAGPDVSRPRSWIDVLSRDDVSFVDPLRSSAPAAALLAMKAESTSTGASEDEIDVVMAPLAQRLGARGAAPSNLTDLALDLGGAAILSEQQLLTLRGSGLARDLEVTVPETGTPVLDYPMVALTSEPAAVKGGELLGGYLRSPEGSRLLAVEGFRPENLQPLPRERDGSAGPVTVLAPPEADVIATTLHRWSVLTVPSRILGVFDVSGSMDFRAGQRSRIALAVGASQKALETFPGQAQFGIWAFSEGLGRADRDYRELVPVRRLDARIGGRYQRQEVGDTLARLQAMTSGGTGLYDSTLAAVRAARSGYDANAMNSVFLLTDGENEDTDSVTLRQLLRTLERERDQDRPVSVIAIGVGPDADEDALKKIVAATGGRHYIARDPGDISTVFRDALTRG